MGGRKGCSMPQLIEGMIGGPANSLNMTTAILSSALEDIIGTHIMQQSGFTSAELLCWEDWWQGNPTSAAAICTASDVSIPAELALSSVKQQAP